MQDSYLLNLQNYSMRRRTRIPVASAKPGHGVKKEFKQTDLADFALLTKTSIGKIERGQQNFTIETLYAIAEVLKVKPESLLKID